MKTRKFEKSVVALTVVGSLVMSGTVILSLVRILLFLAVPLFVPTVFAQTTPATRLEAAIEKEQVDGNVKSAMDVYQKIAADSSVPKSVRAKALLQLAGSYEKLGQQAQKVYEQILRDFAGEPAAAQARTRLAVLRQADRGTEPATMTQRKIESAGLPVSFYGTDGQRAIYHDATTNALVIGDLTGKNKRVIFKPKEGDQLLGATPSRDFSITELELRKPDGSEAHAVIKADGTGYLEIVGGSFLCPPDFSWDNRYLLKCELQPDYTTRLLTISVSDGQIRELRRTIEGTIINRASFSPDRHFIAYSTNRGEVSIVPVEGGEPRLVSNTAILLDWTRDGRFLVIADDRSGSTALELFPIRDDRQVGDGIFLRYGSFEWGRTTTSGALVYQSTPPGGRLIQSLASLDPDGHLGAWKRSTASSDGNQYAGMLMWSPDGSQIAYVAGNRAAGQNGTVVHVHNMTSGEDRELYRSSRPLYCAWAAQHPNLFCDQETERGSEVISVAVDTGHAERIASLPGPRFVLAASRDDRALYMFSRAPKWGLVRWEIDTHQETVLEEFSNPRVPNVIPSPDDRWLLRRANQDLEIRPMSGGAWKRLVSVNIETSGPPSNAATFTPDNKWLLYRDKDSFGREGLFRVSTAGGNPERMGDFPGGASRTYQTYPAMHVSADGRNFIVVSPDSSNLPELWLLENFVPAAK